MQTSSTPKLINTSFNAFLKNEPAKVVVVDDHPYSRVVIVDLMSLEGYQVTEFDSSINLVSEIINIQPDLILLDVILPGTNGLEICRELRENESTQSIPVIFMSASTEQQLKINGQATGGNDFLNKPVKPLELCNKVKNLIAQKRLKK